MSYCQEEQTQQDSSRGTFEASQTRAGNSSVTNCISNTSLPQQKAHNVLPAHHRRATVTPPIELHYTLSGHLGHESISRHDMNEQNND
jgi:hypothetical protein